MHSLLLLVQYYYCDYEDEEEKESRKHQGFKLWYRDVYLLVAHPLSDRFLDTSYGLNGIGYVNPAYTCLHIFTAFCTSALVVHSLVD